VRLPVSQTLPLGEATPPQIWQSYRAELVRFVAGRVNDATIADDIVHDVLLKAFSQLGTLENRAQLRAWLFRITRNAIVDHYRARRPTEQLPDELRAEFPVETKQAEQELARCLAPLLGALPSPYRQALTLAEVDGLTQREIAKREGLSLSGAKSRVQRARKMLRDALLACCRVELDRQGGVVDYRPHHAGCDECADSGPSEPQSTLARRCSQD
jgi:RNA polymerase sigma-70 factor (ECF subfamily)